MGGMRAAVVVGGRWGVSVRLDHRCRGGGKNQTDKKREQGKRTEVHTFNSQITGRMKGADERPCTDKWPCGFGARGWGGGRNFHEQGREDPKPIITSDPETEGGSDKRGTGCFCGPLSIRPGARAPSLRPWLPSTGSLEQRQNVRHHVNR